MVRGPWHSPAETGKEASVTRSPEAPGGRGHEAPLRTRAQEGTEVCGAYFSETAEAMWPNEVSRSCLAMIGKRALSLASVTSLQS